MRRIGLNPRKRNKYHSSSRKKSSRRSRITLKKTTTIEDQQVNNPEPKEAKAKNIKRTKTNHEEIPQEEDLNLKLTYK